LAVLASAAAKKIIGWTSVGIVTTKVIPGTCINSPTWLMFASPRATTAATGSPDGGPRTFRLLSAARRRAVVISSVQTVGNERDPDGTAQDQFREKHVTQVTGERLSELP
jgi:hypothetical protein